MIVIKPSIVYAHLNDVTCDDKGCSGFSEKLFYDLDLKPGDSYSESFCITNDRSEKLSAVIWAKEDPENSEIFKKVLEVLVENNSQETIFAGSLYDFLIAQTNLGKINSGDNECYTISIYFPHDAGNDYQENKAIFDLVLRITGEESGETEVLSSSTETECESCETSTDIKSILGEVLGLSDTSSLKTNIFYILGFSLSVFGITLILKRNRNIKNVHTFKGQAL